MRMRFCAAALLAMMLAATLAAESARAEAVCGDVNNTGSVSTSDALAVLRKSVGQDVTLICPPSGGVQATGQTTCYDSDGSPIGCAGTGQDGDLQLGVARNLTDNGDGTITDNVTGLMWEKLSDDGSIHDRDNSYSWADAMSARIAALNAAEFAGHDDWRLPNRFELDSIVNLGASGPAAPAAFSTGCAPACTVLTCSCTRPDYYWTSSTYDGAPSYAWTVYFAGGDAFSGKKTTPYFARAVRGGS